MPQQTQETKLEGGRSASEVIRVGDTIHRTKPSNWEYTQALLKYLNEQNFPYAPRFIGNDPQGREILSFIEGTVYHENKEYTDEQLILVTLMLKKLHDVTEHTVFAKDKEVVCHNDASPWNTVFLNEKPVSFIDYDEVVPGTRITNLAYMIWTFTDLGEDIAPEKQKHKIQLISDTYQLENREFLIDAILEEQQRILNFRVNQANDLDKNISDFAKQRVADILRQVSWVKKHREIITPR